MKFKDGVIFVGALVFGLGMASAANACSTALWSDSTGSIAAGSPSTNPRFAQLCALKVTGDGSVRDLSPDHTRIRARFYVLTKSTDAVNVGGLTGATGTAVLLRAYADETDTATIFEIKRVDGNLVFDTTGDGGTPATVLAVNGWTAVEFDWQSGGNMSIWVNKDPALAATATVGAGTGTVKSVRLGLIGGLTGFTGNVVFDAYEAHSTTPVGLLLDGDSNNSGSVNSGDTVGVVNEYLGGILAVGTPDCNRDGKVNSGDTVCIINKYLGS